jgi:hypothetical protein
VDRYLWEHHMLLDQLLQISRCVSDVLLERRGLDDIAQLSVGLPGIAGPTIILHQLRNKFLQPHLLDN